jgi:antitoxin component YwqK of YwqJK toxin-antitoxin module
LFAEPSGTGAACLLAWHKGLAVRKVLTLLQALAVAAALPRASAELAKPAVLPLIYLLCTSSGRNSVVAHSRESSTKFVNRRTAKLNPLKSVLIRDPMKRTAFALLLLTAATTAQAQKMRRFTTYFDSTNTRKREIYSAVVAGDTVMEGPYKRFYRSGKLEAQTRYAGGKRDSSYVEFHPNGQRRLEVTYQQGVRQGPFKTYYETGKPAQEGTYDNDQPTGTLRYYHPNGEVKLETTLAAGQPAGAVRELYPSGKPKVEITYQNGQANGPVKTYYPNGQLQSEATYSRGLLAGPYKTYYDNGQTETEVLADKSGKGSYRSYYRSGKLQTEGSYVASTFAGRAVKNPLGDDLTKQARSLAGGTSNLEGPAKAYYESGALKSKMTYRQGVLTGTQEDFYESGKPEQKIEHANQGRDRKVTAYFEDGTVKAEQQFKAGQPAGQWRTFHPGGKQPATQETYVNGRLAGEKLSYSPTGTVLSKLVYENGKPTGLGQEFYESGKLKAETTYVKGLKTGTFRQLREDGTPETTGFYRNGKQSGVWTTFGPDGKTVQEKATYRNGQLVPEGTAAPAPKAPATKGPVKKK